MAKDPSASSKKYTIDPDGVGGIPPFTLSAAACTITLALQYLTTTALINTMTVDGFEELESFSRTIKYSNSLSEIAAVTAVSTHCKQYLKYECSKSRLFLDGPWAWWVSRDGQKMYYWEGADPANNQSCACYRLGNCYTNIHKCNCDANGLQWRTDEGHLTDKSTLPVTELRFGDTGTDDKDMARFTLGTLYCQREI